jgi:mono/diheme cytochrome c family protein
MRRALKWLGIGLGALVGLLCVAAIGMSVIGGTRLERPRVVEPEAIAIPTDSAALARGGRVVHFACEGCHGPDLTGLPLVQGGIGTVYSANITGLGATRRDADLVRAIRHAVAPDGRELAIMPAYAFVFFSREDLGAVIAHLKTLAHAGADRPKPQFGFVGRIMVASGMLDAFFAARQVDHHAPFPSMPEIGANVATGEYYSRFCRGCHGTDLHGGHVPDPAAPAAPNLVITKRWSEDQFIDVFRTGRTPEGLALNPDYMPWRDIAKLSHDELRGLYMYLQTLPQ